jgi:NAD(P)-dependent dehydrogenase (short-subunit alcohol dehydrogenase family)
VNSGDILRVVTARLDGRRVLVVGAGTRRSDENDAPVGNGRAIAVLAAREGAAVACADIDGDAAGVWLDNTSPEDWDRVFAVNTRAHFLVCKGAMPRLA